MKILLHYHQIFTEHLYIAMNYMKSCDNWVFYYKYFKQNFVQQHKTEDIDFINSNCYQIPPKDLTIPYLYYGHYMKFKL